MFKDYTTRSKIIKRIILWSVILGTLLAMVYNPLKVKSFAEENYLTNNYELATETKPSNPCEAIGGCVWEIERYNEGTTLERVSLIIFDVVYFLIYLAGAIAVIMIVYGAFLILTAAGDDAKYKAGKEAVINAAIGLVIVILSFTIVNVIQQILTNLRI